MSANTTAPKTRKPRKNAPQNAAAPEPEVETLPPAAAPAPAPEPAPEAEPLTPAEAAREAAAVAEEKLAEAKAHHAAACETLRLAKLAVVETGKAAARAEKPQMTCLDAAFTVLLGWAESRNTKELTKEMRERGLWKSAVGVTPWSTLYAAIIREIAAKGEAARFVRDPQKNGSFLANPAFDPAA